MMVTVTDSVEDEAFCLSCVFSAFMLFSPPYSPVPRTETISNSGQPSNRFLKTADMDGNCFPAGIAVHAPDFIHELDPGKDLSRIGEQLV